MKTTGPGPLEYVVMLTCIALAVVLVIPLYLIRLSFSVGRGIVRRFRKDGSATA